MCGGGEYLPANRVSGGNGAIFPQPCPRDGRQAHHFKPQLSSGGLYAGVDGGDCPGLSVPLLGGGAGHGDRHQQAYHHRGASHRGGQEVAGPGGVQLRGGGEQPGVQQPGRDV